MLETIGPVWDGNEVWLVVAAGATFAAFPAWYATMFSGFYLALLLILVLLIVRVLSFEWRERGEGARWRGALALGEHRRQRRRAVPVGRRAAPASCTASRWTATATSPGNVLDLFSAYTVLAGRRGRAAVRAPRRDVPHAADERRAARARRPRRAAAAACRWRSSCAAFLACDGRGRASTATTATSCRAAGPGGARRRRARARGGVRARAARSGWAFAMTARGAALRRGDALHRRCIRACSSRRRTSQNSLTIADAATGALRAERDHGRRRDPAARRAALPGLDVPRVPRPAPAPAERVAGLRAVPALDPRLVRRTRSVRPLLARRRRARRWRPSCRWSPQAALLGADRRRRVRRRPLAALRHRARRCSRWRSPCAARSAGAMEVAGRRAAADVLSELRLALVERRLAAQPIAVDGTEAGEIAAAAVQGVDALEATSPATSRSSCSPRSCRSRSSAGSRRSTSSRRC